MNFKKLVFIPLLLMLKLFCFGQDEMKAGLIYGNNHAYSLSAPDGWVLDNNSGVNQGLYAVFYREGESWAKAITVMYTNTASLENEPHKTIKELMDFDSNTFKKEDPDIQITNGDNIPIKDSVFAYVKNFTGKNFEAVAYIDAGKTAVMIVMSSLTKEGFYGSMKSFTDLVKSYLFLTDKVVIEKQK